MNSNEEIFAKTVSNLNNDQCLKTIDVLRVGTLNELKERKAKAAAIVAQTDKLDFALYFFYIRSNKLVGFQYIVSFGLDESSSNILADLFAAHVLRLQRLSGVKNTHSIKNLGEYFGTQIRGYKEYIKKEKN